MDFRARLGELLRKDALMRGRFVLSSGVESDYYLDCRRVTLSGEGAYLVGELFSELALSLGATAVAGLTLGADPLVVATGLISYRRGTPLKMVIVRKESKTHGLQRRVEGPPLDASDRVLVLEDVATTGSSSLMAVKAVKEEFGCKVVGVAAVVDRGAGAEELLRKHGVRFVSLFKKDELL